MARNWTYGDGTATSSWHTSIIATNWDAGVPEKGTPGSYNGYSVSGTTSQLNGNASGTIYISVREHGTTTATATASFNATGTYQMHLFSGLYDFFAFRDSTGTIPGQYNSGEEPRRTLDNNSSGYNLTSSGVSNVDFEVALNPVISSLTPSTANIGDTITIAGLYFGDSTTTAQGTVYISNTNIDAGNYINSWSSTSISVTIPPATSPPGPQTGNLSVKVGWTPWATSSLTIEPTVSTSTIATDKSVIVKFDSYMDGSNAGLTSNYTLESPIGTSVSLTDAWTEFRGNKVYLKGLNLTVGNTFSVTANSNVKSIEGTAIDTASSTATGTVVAAPTISSITPNSTITGATITVTGTNFGATTGNLYFNPGPPTAGTPPTPIEATINSWSPTTITAVIPSDAKSGPITVRTSDGVESEFSQSAFLNILADANFQILEENTNNMVSSSTARIVIGSPLTGPQLYYVGDTHNTSNTNGTTTVPNVSSMGFSWAFDNSGAHVVSRGKELDTGTTTVFTLATSSTVISGTITGAAANRTLVIWADPMEGSGEGLEWREPVFVETNTNGTTSYNIGLSATGTYVIGVEDPGFGGTSSSSPKVAPSPVEVNASSLATSTANFEFQDATARIHGKIEKAGGVGFDLGPGVEAFHVWGYQPIENGLSAAAMPDANGEFDLYVNPGVYIIGVGGPDLPSPVEKQIEVKSGDTNFALTDSTTDITLIIKAPEEYIEGQVTDSNGNAISGASVFAWRATGPGGGQAITDSNGYYKLYVSSGTYTVEGFAPTYGKLTARTGIEVTADCHTDSSCPSVDFGVSSELATISGTVTKNGTLTQDIEVWITSGETGYGMNRTRTASDGSFTLKVPYGSGYYLHAAQPGRGEIYRASLPTFNNDNSTTSVAITVNTATINVRISPASAFSSAFVEARNTTSTEEKGFSDKDVSAVTTYREYSIEVVKPTTNETWTYNIEGGVPGYGPLTPTTTAISSSTQSVTKTINLGSVWQVSGTISDPDPSTTANEAEGAFVWAASSTAHGGGKVDSSGNFSFNLKEGIYDFGIDKKNYTGTIIANQSITADASITTLALSPANQTIAGTVSVSGTAESGAWVWATNGAGGWAGDETDGNGSYSLKVTSGTWQVRAVSEGYEANPQSVEVSSGTSTLNISLSAISGYTVATPTTGSIVPKTGGVVQGDNVTVDAPAGALDSQDSNTGRVTIQKTTSVPQTNGVKPLGSAAYEISAANASGTPITILDDDITITLTYSAADLTTAGLTQAQAAELDLGYWDSTNNNWVTIPTNAATTTSGGVIFTGTTQHLSPYAPLKSSGANPPPTPTNLTASAGNERITLNWSASSGATKYNIYRKSGNFYPYLDQTTATSYIDTGLTNEVTYYYKISALNDDDDESTSTEAVSATPKAPSPAAGSEYIFSPTPAAEEVTEEEVATPTEEVATPTEEVVTPTKEVVTKPIKEMTVEELKAEITRITALIAQLQTQLAELLEAEEIEKVVYQGIPINFTFAKTLKYNQTSDEVKYLQIILKVEVGEPTYPEDVPATGFFGPITKAAVIEFQEKYSSEILAPWGITKGTGLVGKTTRAKLNELLGK
jgi:hypothetical protein